LLADRRLDLQGDGRINFPRLVAHNIEKIAKLVNPVLLK